MAETTGNGIPEFMNLILDDDQPVSARVVAERAVLALNESMLSLYETSLAKFKQNMRERVPIILALFTGQGGQMILYRPGQDPEVAPPVPILYQLAKSVVTARWPSMRSSHHTFPMHIRINCGTPRSRCIGHKIRLPSRALTPLISQTKTAPFSTPFWNTIWRSWTSASRKAAIATTTSRSSSVTPCRIRSRRLGLARVSRWATG